MRNTQVYMLFLGVIGTIVATISACTLQIDPASSSVSTPHPEVSVTETLAAARLETGIGLNSVIFNAEQSEAVRSWAAPWATGTWPPSPEDVAGLEATLIPYLQSAEDAHFRTDPPIWERLEGYNVQYLGLEENGQKIIYANFFCATMANDNWTEDFYQIDDGGDCVFQVKYDVENGTFYDLSVNGEA